MKKFLALVLCLAILASLSAAAMADDPQTEDYPEVGLTVTYPAEFDNLKGQFFPYPIGSVDSDIYLCEFLYIAMDAESFEQINNMDDEEFDAHPELMEQVRNAQFSAGLLEAVKEGTDPGELFEGSGLSWTEVGRADDLVWYYADTTAEEDAGEFDVEYKAVGAGLLEALKGAKYYQPAVFGAELVGQTYAFKAMDTEGNELSFADICAQHEFTMLNCWATWCGPCVGELTELAEMNRELAEKDCAIIGLMMDGEDEETIEKGKAIMAENGVDYLVLVMNEELEDIFELEAFPTSFFFDRSGKLVALPFEGAAPSAYEDIFESLLDGEAVDTDPTDVSAAVANNANAYRVFVTDVDGKGVEGVKVQFCDDATCTVHKTDADGLAVFEADEGSYTIHVIKVPDGYEKFTGEVETLDTYSDVNIILQKAA